ncbi:DnaB-like helicase N-terminal domain-containing protein [Streptacidiphilus neutrinimicus]|uniref:DnaB-like helicase N-terminal domain-containing protein n=1 Tax=Streptacidiphilus neutrinimicus TaxID=105420 RepID=UPI0013787FFC|nr:DnaB-like helicase N-terminal domain-containing protein [Streptacidiphilus neutrinimicus]
MDAERAVLAACLHSPTALDTAGGMLGAEDFASPAHGLVWAAMLALRQEDCPVDPVLVTHQLRRQGVLHQAGGPAYVSGLASAVHSVAAVDHYAAIVAEQAWSARLHALGKWLIQATVHGHDPAEVQTEAVNRLSALAAGRSLSGGCPRPEVAVVRPLHRRPAS